MNNKLVSANGLWYKIKKFFKGIFSKEKSYNLEETNIAKKEQKNNNFVYDNDLKEKFEKENKNKILAEKLLCGDINISELNDEEVDEMTEYFTKDIQNIDNELLRIKQHILYMQKELKK